jgi:hypothetical protein
MLRDDLINAFSTQQPEWWISFAEIDDLKEVMRSLNYAESSPGEPVAAAFQRNRDMLKRRIAERLTMPLRAAVHAGLVTEGCDKTPHPKLADNR